MIKNVLQRMQGFLLLVIVAGFALRLFLVWYLDNYHAPIAWEYGEIARNLHAGKGYLYLSYRSWMPPIYPLLLAGLMRVFGGDGFLALEIVQAALSAGTGLLLHLLGRRLFGRSAGQLALVLMILYPPLAIKTAYVDPITVEIFLLAGAFVFLYRCMDGGSLVDRVMAGGCLGLCALSRPTLLAFVVVLSCGWLLWRKGQGRNWGVILTVFVVCLLPWTLRNYAVQGELVLVSSNGGFNFWIGNNPLATGEAYAWDGKPMWTKMPRELKEKLAGLSEGARDRALYQEGLRFIRQDPAGFFKLALKRIGYFWWFRPQAGSGDLTYPALWSLGYYVLYGLLLVAGMAGLFASRLRWRDLLPFYALFLSLTLVYIVFFVHTRYRMILEPFLMVFAARWMLSLWTTLRNKRW